MSWIDGILNQIEPLITNFILSYQSCHNNSQISIIKCSNCYNYQAFFIPSHALRLSSFLTNKNPCRYAGKANLLLSSKPKYLLLNRKSRTRYIMNIEDVVDSMKKYTNTNISEIYFDNSSYLEQQVIMEDVDIVIAPHGAALGNLFYLKPCSAVIEYFPFGVCSVFFSKFYRPEAIDIQFY